MTDTLQSEIIGWLKDPASHGLGAGEVEHLQTHGAHVFLVGDIAYKIKRAVKLPYLDFSTLDKREWACRREVELNRRTAPAIYRRAAAITRAANGVLMFDDEGEVVEWAVVMTRFPQSALFDHMARMGTISFEHCRALARRVAEFHGRAEVISADGDLERNARGQIAVAEGNFASLRARPDLFTEARVAELEVAVRAQLTALAPLLARRQQAGCLRHCHGDLHLGNICLFEGEPTLFDCLEFDDELATTDVLYDLAFLIMDLDEHGLAREANLILNHYLEQTDEFDGLAALPLFLSQRSTIRAKVAADAEAVCEEPSRRAALIKEAVTYLKAALDYIRPREPRMVCVGGLSGSGKTSLARAVAPSLGAVPGAIHLRSDQIRKALFGRGETERLPPECYRGEVSARVYDLMYQRARILLRAKRSVILDAVFNRPEDREYVAALAAEEAVPFQGIWLDVPGELLTRRVRERRGDASDATPEVVERQLRQELGPMTWRRIEGSPDPESVAVQVRNFLGI